MTGRQQNGPDRRTWKPGIDFLKGTYQTLAAVEDFYTAERDPPVLPMRFGRETCSF